MREEIQIVETRPVDAPPVTVREIPHRALPVAAGVALKRRWPLAAGVVVGCSALSYLLCQSLTPLYGATTSVMIDTRAPSPAASRTNQTAMSPSEETLRKNEIAAIRSRGLAVAVVDRLSLQEIPEFNPALRRSPERYGLPTLAKSARTWLTSMLPKPADPDPTAERTPEDPRGTATAIFLGQLTATSTEASRVIEIRFRSEDPRRAAWIANTVADEYISQKIAQQIAGPQLVAKSVEQDIDALNEKIRDSERIIETLRSERGLLPTTNARVAVEQLAELNKQLVIATGDRAGAESRLAELTSTTGPDRANAAAAVLASPLIQRLQADAASLGARLQLLLTTYGETYPKVVEARAELKDLRARIDAEVAKVVSSYRNAVVVAKAKESFLRQQVETLKAQVTRADSAEVDVRALERETEADRNLLTQLAARLNDTKAQIKLQGPEARVISSATVPRVPSFPPTLAITAAVILVSAAGATIVVVLLERGDDTIRSMAQIRELTAACILGAVPLVKRTRRDGGLLQRHVLARQRSQFAESLRAISFQIDHVWSIPTKVLLITSSVSSEGKTSLATCLARIMALAGRRVVIVDADLRNPSLHRMFAVAQSPGLTDLIEDKRGVYQILQFDRASSASIITAGGFVPSPADALQSRQISRLFRILAADFDTVIVDSPPFLAANDARILAQYADATIMVVRWGSTTATTLLTTLQRMADLKVRLSGIALSMVDSRRYQRHGYSDSALFSRTFRKYYSET